MKGARLGSSPTRPSSLGPGVAGQPVASKQDRQTFSKASPESEVVRSQGTETNLQAATKVNDRSSPVSYNPAGIAARAGRGVAEPLFAGRRRESAVDQLGERSRRDSRGKGGGMWGQSRGLRLEIPLGPPDFAVGTLDIPEAEIPRGAGRGSRRGLYERRRGVTPLEQRAPASATLSNGGGTA